MFGRDTIGEQYKNNANIKYVVNCVKDLAFNSYQEYRVKLEIHSINTN